MKREIRLEKDIATLRPCTIFKLPTEILREIFNYYVHDRSRPPQLDPAEDSDGGRCIAAYTDSRTDPIDLTHVCRMWRTTAISIPSLWATIYVYNPLFEEDVENFKLWLERSAGSSGAYPLDLTIKQHLPSRFAGISPRRFLTREKYQALGQIISLAIAQHQRWKHISLELRAETEANLQPLYGTSLPILHGFKISLQNWPHEKLRQLICALCSSPELRSVALGRESCKFTDTQLLLDVVPWDRGPTTLDFATLKDKILLRILSSSAATLQHISVSELTLFPYLHSNSSQSTALPHATMPHLRSIRVDTMLPGDAAALFDKLTLPALDELCLPKGFGASKTRMLTRGWDALVRLLERSRCKLLTLEFGGSESPGSGLTEVFLSRNLKSSPVFEHLTMLRVTAGIGSRPDTLQLLDALSESREEGSDIQEPRILPLLETLILEDVSSLAEVRRMLHARIAAYGGSGKSKLRRVCADLVGRDYSLDMILPSPE